MRPYSSQPTPSNWHTPSEKGCLNTPHELFHHPKAPLCIIAVMHFTFFDTMYHPLFFWVTKLGILNHMVFTTNNERINHVSTFLRQDNCIHQTTWSHSINQLQFHSANRDHDTLYGSNTPPLNSQVLATFCPSATTSATH